MSKVLFVALIFFTSCKENSQDILSQQNQAKKLAEMLNYDSVPTDLDTTPDIGTGYNKISNTYLPTCFKQIDTITPTAIQETFISYKDDLNEESLRNVLDIDLSAKIPIQGVITLNPRFVFSRDASVSTLSHTSTYIAYALLGQKQLVPYTQTKLVLKPQFRQYFDSSGHLQNAYDFIRLCGDEITNIQKLSSKVVMTTKLSFQSQDDKVSFEADLGVSPTITPDWVINVKIKDLDIQLRKRLMLNFYAIQFGGQPERLLSAIKATSCTLDDISKCQTLLDALHDYMSNDYPLQLVPTALDRWNVEDVQSLPYYLSDIYDENGMQLSFDVISNSNIIDKLDQMKLSGQSHAIIEQKNYQAADMMKQKSYLATDEKATLDQITTTALANIQSIRLFGQNCYKDLTACLASTPTDTFAKIIQTYDTSLLGVDIGVLISKVYASTKVSSFFNTRVSDDFVVLQPELRAGVYSSYYIKFKNLKNYIIKNSSVSVDLSCTSFFVLSTPLIQSAFQYYEILQPQMAINYKSKCADTNPLFVSSPKGFDTLLAPDKQFIVELWGRD